jgi:hypothetical protein
MSLNHSTGIDPETGQVKPIDHACLGDRCPVCFQRRTVCPDCGRTLEDCECS